MKKIWSASFEVADFAAHFYKMSDENILKDIRSGIDLSISRKIPDSENCFLAKCILDAEKKMKEVSEINTANVLARWNKAHENQAPKPKRPKNVSPDGEVIERKATSKMVIPTQDDVNCFATESALSTNEAKKFFCYYDSNGWRVGKNPMKNWKSAFKGWCARATDAPPSRAQPKTFAQIDEEERLESYRKAQERIDNYGK